jgi:HK97 family phage major capsid protein
MKSSDEFEIATKATTTRASVVGNQYALELPDVGQLATRRNSFYEFIASNGRILNVPKSANGTVRYIDWDQASIVRAAAMVAEGSTFPESTAVWQTYTVQLKKVGDMLPWTDEFEYDDAFLVSELQQFLLINVGLVKNSQMINGDGTGNNLSGIITVAPTYTPVAAAISDASIYDLFVILRQTIEAQTGSKYRTNFALMNIVDINRYKLKKDANENYIMPPFYDAAGNRIDGVTVIEDNAVTANTMFIGDVNYTRLYAADGVVVKRGYINDDFSTGKERLRVYERCLFLIRTVDRTGFLKVTNITTALATLAS